MPLLLPLSELARPAWASSRVCHHFVTLTSGLGLRANDSSLAVKWPLYISDLLTMLESLPQTYMELPFPVR
jgi:hypothetical protein